MYAILSNGEYTLIEKKSKFITRSFIVNSEEEVGRILDDIRKREKGATHNCYAYRILSNGGIIERKNDDGEPGGTAGAPMLSVLAGEDIINALAVTTRYFGGIKLGSGGLVSAYKRGVVEVLNLSQKRSYIVRSKYILSFNINEVRYIDSIVEKNNLIVLYKNFGEKVIFELSLSLNEKTIVENLLSGRKMELKVL